MEIKLCRCGQPVATAYRGRSITVDYCVYCGAEKIAASDIHPEDWPAYEGDEL